LTGLPAAFVFADYLPNLTTYAYVCEKVMMMNIRVLSLSSLQLKERYSAEEEFKGLNGILFGG
jgi:hypothetical protein